MAIFNLKAGDTRPILEVVIKNPDATVHDLTGSTGWKLRIWLNTGVILERDMVVYGDATLGTLRYSWLATDWDTGGLVVGPSLPTSVHEREHRMEYEVTGSGGSKMTFPNDGWDTLRIYAAIA